MPNEIAVKSVLNKKRKRDSWFLDDYTINLYSGCSFNCLYCYIRGSKYGEHMEKSLSVKINALEILDRQLFNRAKKQQHGIIIMSSATDPYLQFEKEYELTRQALEIILKHRFPLHVLTKSDLVTRDFDLLKKIDEAAIIPLDLQPKLQRGVIISFSFSTLEDEVSRIFEPGATPPSRRLETLRQVKQAGFLCGVSLMPLLPYISDTTESLERFFRTFKVVGVDYVMPATLTLFGTGPGDSKTLVLRVVEKHYPHLLEKYQKFFSASSEMPSYYSNAFYKKMRELAEKYDMPNRIMEV